MKQHRNSKKGTTQMKVRSNSAKFTAHSILLSLEAFLLVALVIGFAFPKLDFADRVFLQEPGVLRFQLDEGEPMLAKITGFRCYYTTKSDRQLSERQAQSIPIQRDKDAVYEIRLPQGTLEFRLDVNCNEAGATLTSPPKVRNVAINGKNVRATWLTPFSFPYASRTVLGYNYCPAPYFNGYFPEYLIICICVWLVAMVIALSWLRRCK